VRAGGAGPPRMPAPLPARRRPSAGRGVGLAGDGWSFGARGGGSNHGRWRRVIETFGRRAGRTDLHLQGRAWGGGGLTPLGGAKV